MLRSRVARGLNGIHWVGRKVDTKGYIIKVAKCGSQDIRSAVDSKWLGPRGVAVMTRTSSLPKHQLLPTHNAIFVDFGLC